MLKVKSVGSTVSCIFHHFRVSYIEVELAVPSIIELFSMVCLRVACCTCRLRGQDETAFAIKGPRPAGRR